MSKQIQTKDVKAAAIKQMADKKTKQASTQQTVKK